MEGSPLSDAPISHGRLNGGCLCRAIRYEIQGHPKSTAICHCTHCQRVSGSAFSVNLFTTPDQLEVIGVPAHFEDIGESGKHVQRYFCSRCGSSLYSILSTGMIAIKAGTLDNVATIHPRTQYWQRSAQGWLGELAGLPGYGTVPVKT